MRDKVRWRSRLCRGNALALMAMTIAGTATAAQLKQATVTRIIHEVQLLPTGAAARTAALNDTVGEKTAVRTGADSRGELTFTDQTLARLGANTVFTFEQGTRNLDLAGGVMLLRVPKNAGGARISTAAVSAAITGTTLMLEYHKHSYSKAIVLEGVVRVYLRKHLGESVLVKAGQMLIVNPDANELPDPIDIDLKKLIDTSLLIVDFAPLASAPLIQQEVQTQLNQKLRGKLSDTNLVIYGSGTGVSLIDPPEIDLLSLNIGALFFAAAGGGFGPETGPLQTIISPNPYVILATTKIQTAPLITTAGVTQQGKLFRSAALDGDPATYLFGSVRPFDQTSGFNESLKQPTSVPVAAFRFTNLQLAGNPTITIPGGGATKLALISEGTITSAPPGGTLNFNGLDTLILATENAPINLTADVTFSNLALVTFYARGTGSNLTVGSPVQTVTTLNLLGEGSIAVNANENIGFLNADAGVDYLGGTGIITTSGVTINAGNNLSFVTNNVLPTVGSAPAVVLRAGGTIDLDVRTSHGIFTLASSVLVNGATINVISDAAGTLLAFDNAAQVQFTAGAGGIQAPGAFFKQASGTMEFGSNGDIVAGSITGGDMVSALGNIQTLGDLIANTISANGDINSGGDLTAFVSVTAGNNIGVTNTLLSPTVTAGGDITAGHVEVQNINLNAPAPFTSNLMAAAGGITPFVGASGSGLQHTFNVLTVVSANGIDFTGDHFGPGDNGGLLTINAGSLTLTAAGINGVNFNGAPSPTVLPVAPGNGGTFIANAAGDIIVDSVNLTATTGVVDPGAAQTGGSGGTINLNSANGIVSINNATVQVSSDDPAGAANRRFSSAGGVISILSDKAASTTIYITNTAQLLAWLDATAPGKGGKIIIKNDGNGGTMNVSPKLAQADHGLIDIRQTNSGQLGLTNATLRADIVKVAALGTNGKLIISGGSISADTMLKLYAPDPGGVVEFAGSCQLNGNSQKIIAGDTVRVDTNVTVTVNGPAPADVFAKIAIYNAAQGGNGGTNGMWAGQGVNTHIGVNPPPLDP
jgi:mannose-6-phosphate isomerase-like protein (cupin superfamily)